MKLLHANRKRYEMIRRLFQNKIFDNTLYTLSGKMAAMLLYMAFDIACARLLTPETYAEWVFFYAILTMMFYIGWCGINTSAKVFVSKESDQEKKAGIIRASFLLRLIVSILVSAILILAAYPLARCLGYPAKYPSLYRLCIFAGLLVFLNSFSEFFKGLFMGLDDFKRLCGTTILEFAGYFLWSLLFLLLFRRVEAAALGYMCGGIGVFLFGLASLRQISTVGIFPKRSDNYRSIMRKIFKYAIPLAISSIGGMILVEMDTFMLGMLSSKAQVANYGIAKNLCSKAVHVNYALTVGSMTSFSVLTAENIKKKRTQLKKISNLNILIAASVAGAFLLLGNTVITLLYGVEYQAAGRILIYLLPYYIMYSIASFFGAFLDFQNEAKTRSICYSTIVVINLFLNFLFIPRFGGIGAAVATSLSIVPYTILTVIVTVRIMRRYER